MAIRNMEMAPEAHMDGKRIIIKALGRTWTLVHEDDIESLWESLDEAAFADERIPYWSELWPASLGLAMWLGMRKHEIERRECLDCGCGLGFTALVGQWLGANVLACDYERIALQAAMRSAILSDAPQPCWVCMDWRRPALAKGSIARAWAGDILYEARSMRPVFEMMKMCLAPGGKAWFSEPGRAIFAQFVEICQLAGYPIEPVYKIAITPLRREPPKVPVTIWEMTGV